MSRALSLAAFWLAVLLTLAFVLCPLAVTVSVAFSNAQYLSFPPKGFTLSWFSSSLYNPEFIGPLALSLVLAAVVSLAATTLGTSAAIGVNALSGQARSLIQNFLLSPLVFPMLVTGISLMQFYNAVHLDQVFLQLTIGHVVVTLPYVMRAVSASLQSLDGRIDQAARSLGASYIEAVLKVIIPNIKPGIIAGGLFAFVTSFDNFPVSMWMYNAEYTPLPIAMLSLVQRTLDPSIAAMSTITIVFSIGLALLIERLFGLKKFATS